jgi:hypothetical protein
LLRCHHHRYSPRTPVFELTVFLLPEWTIARFAVIFYVISNSSSSDSMRSRTVTGHGHFLAWCPNPWQIRHFFWAPMRSEPAFANLIVKTTCQKRSLACLGSVCNLGDQQQVLVRFPYSESTRQICFRIRPNVPVCRYCRSGPWTTISLLLAERIEFSSGRFWHDEVLEYNLGSRLRVRSPRRHLE